ncbi:hypothetical protein DOY81_009557, partial [Sarcophaga bullata]
IKLNSMKKLMLVFLTLFALAFNSVNSHGIGCGHEHGHHGGHYGGHHVDFVSLGSHNHGFKGQSDNGGFKGGLVGQTGHVGFPGGYQGNFGDQISYSGSDSGYHRALGGHSTGNVAVQSGLGRLPAGTSRQCGRFKLGLEDYLLHIKVI